MIKILIGGSPCTHWSIAQSKNRETTPEGLGWELFKNYLIAKEKYKPDYFLYENNKSAAKPIKDQISYELGVSLQYINSSLVSAQNRQRFYAHNIPNVPQPEDNGIFLKDILESGVPWLGKSYCMTASYYKCAVSDTVKVNPRTMIAEPVIFNVPHGYNMGGIKYEKTPTMTSSAWTDNNLVIERSDGKHYPVYEVKNGLITIKDKQYPIRLIDGYYIIRKLSVLECKRLQTVPDDYLMPCSKSQNYKMLGNGWTIDIIAHILSHIPNIRNEKVEVLSMYDGMSCGHIALDKIA